MAAPKEKTIADLSGVWVMVSSSLLLLIFATMLVVLTNPPPLF